MNDATKTALLMLRDRVKYGIPRCISANTLNSLHIYVDTSCEGDKVGLGGVIINERGTRLGHFSEFASPAVIAKVNPDSGNPIVEIECFAMYIALHLWHKLALGTNTVIFTDNEGALVKHTHELCDNSHLNLWFERVNTHANIADAPSRGVSNDELGKRFEVNLEDEVADIALSRGGL